MPPILFSGRAGASSAGGREKINRGRSLGRYHALALEDDAPPRRLPAAFATALRRFEVGWPYDASGFYDEATAADDLAACAPEWIVEAYYAARAILHAAGERCHVDLERICTLKELGNEAVARERWAAAESRYLWARRLLYTKTDWPAGAAALAVACHANRAEALLRQRRPREALLECRATLLLDPDHWKARARVKRADEMLAEMMADAAD